MIRRVAVLMLVVATASGCADRPPAPAPAQVAPAERDAETLAAASLVQLCAASAGAIAKAARSMQAASPKEIPKAAQDIGLLADDLRATSDDTAVKLESVDPASDDAKEARENGLGVLKRCIALADHASAVASSPNPASQASGLRTEALEVASEAEAYHRALTPRGGAP